jgi:nucleoside 2-deoxyribosyltransferase
MSTVAGAAGSASRVGLFTEDPRRRIYVATRLWDFDEKLKAERLERAVLAGTGRAAANHGVTLPTRPLTFVPFRDSAQDSLVSAEKTRMLYDQDVAMIDHAVLLVTYLDGLAKDEGVCFELGYAHARNVPTIVVSTDFIQHSLPSGQVVPFDPVLLAGTTAMIRVTDLPAGRATFEDTLRAAQDLTLDKIAARTCELLCEPVSASPPTHDGQRAAPVTSSPAATATVFVDLGGEVFEWQADTAHRLVEAAGPTGRVRVIRPSRYRMIDGAAEDLRAAVSADVVVLGCDGDECPGGTAFIQGLAKGRGIPVWLYDSKVTRLVGPGGYTSSRNLMLDYSADRVFRSMDALLSAIASL